MILSLAIDLNFDFMILKTAESMGCNPALTMPHKPSFTPHLPCSLHADLVKPPLHPLEGEWTSVLRQLHKMDNVRNL